MELAREDGSVSQGAMANNAEAAALLAQGRLGEAEDRYQLAQSAYRAQGRALVGLPALAGLIEVALARGEIAVAKERAEDLLTALASDPAAADCAPPDVLRARWRALTAADDDRASQALDDARRIMTARAASIPDEAARGEYRSQAAVTWAYAVGERVVPAVLT